MTLTTSTNTDHGRIATEVLELGETLFDALLDLASDSAKAAASEPLPDNELRTAADEFFQALRVLLVLDEGTGVVCDNGNGQEGG
jgi:hypothetical protein